MRSMQCNVEFGYQLNICSDYDQLMANENRTSRAAHNEEHTNCVHTCSAGQWVQLA
jgi:hypothetical protein